MAPLQLPPKFIPKFMPIRFFWGVHFVLRCYRASGTPRRKILEHSGMLPCLDPLMATNYVNWYLVLISFWMLTMPWIFIRFAGMYLAVVLLTWYTDALQTCFSFCCCAHTQNHGLCPNLSERKPPILALPLGRS